MVFNSDIQTSLKCDLIQYIDNYHMALVYSCYHNTSKWHPKTIITLNYFSLLLRHVEELSCYFRHRLSAMQLVKRFVKITFLMDELSRKENEPHIDHNAMLTEVKISYMGLVVFSEEDVSLAQKAQQI